MFLVHWIVDWLIGALALGVALAYGMHLLRPVVGTQQGLTKLTGLPVLSSIARATGTP